MLTGLTMKLRRRLAKCVVAALLITNAVPTGAGAADVRAASTTPTITKSVYGSVYGSDGAAAAVPPPEPFQAGVPLTWNLLTKLNSSVAGALFAAYDSPVSKLSSDERYMAFMTISVNEAQTAGRKLVYVQDRSTGLYQPIKTPDTTGSVLHFDMTPDAHYFAYTYADSIISGKSKVYLYNRLSDTLETVNGISSTNQLNTDDGDYVSISANGQLVVFDTKAIGLVAEDTDEARDVYLYDHKAKTLERISTPKEPSSSHGSWAPVISADDGSRIAFVSTAKLTDAGDFAEAESLYLYDRNAAEGKKLSRITEGNAPSISGDGRYIAFATHRDDLTIGDTNGRTDVYVYDSSDQSFKRVSRLANGSEHAGDSGFPSISRNGAYVAYEVTTDDSEDRSDVYVADRQGFTSSKIEVPGSAIPLLSPSMRPTVGDTGHTVAFFSTYLEKTVGGNFEFFDYFVATNGTAPVWPAGSQLSASSAGADQLTFSWPQVVDSDGIIGYTLYKNGVPVAFTQAVTYTLTSQKREPGRDDVFQVEAIDSRYHRSMNGPLYTWDGGGGENPPPTDIPLMMTWSGERCRSNGPLIQGSKITIQAQGTAKREAKLDWTYMEWNGDSQVSKSSSMMLTELGDAFGFYTGSFTLPPGATELTSMKLTLSGGVGTVEVGMADLLPAPVGGGLQLSFSGATPEELKGAILTVYSTDKGEQTVTLGDTGTQLLTGLWPSDTYALSLYTPDYRYEMGRLNGIDIQSGKTTELTLPVLVPAQVRVKVVNAAGKPVPFVPVTLWDAKHELLQERNTDVEGMTDWVDGLLRDQTVTAELDLSNFYYELSTGANLSLKLDKGDNVLTVQLISPDRGNLELTVKDPSNLPVFNAYVTATQTYKGKPIVTSARTSLDGKARMELFAGDVTLEASQYSFEYTSGPIAAQVNAQTTSLLDIPVRQPEAGVVNLRVYKKALDTEWMGPLDMENERFSTVVQSKYGWIRTYFSNAVTLGGRPGMPVEVCVSGQIYAYVNQCTTVNMDEHSNAMAEVRLEEKGSRVQGRVDISRTNNYNGNVYRLTPSGSKEWVAAAWDSDFQNDPFNINVPSGGTYRLEMTKRTLDQNGRYQYAYASVDFTVLENQIKPLGTISFSPTSYFTNQTGNSFSSQPAQALPGSTISLRANYQNNSTTTATNAALLLEIPDGMTLVSDAEGHMAVSGGKGAASVEGRTLVVPIGQLAKGVGGTVTYKLAVSPSFNKDSIAATARIKANLDATAVEETIGTVHLDTPKVTIEAPELVSDAGMQIGLSGYAPAGSPVSIYDTDVRIGGAVANASGIWKVQATLADLGNPSTHAVSAQTTLNNVELQSNKVYVQYDKDGPQLVRMAFAQAPDKQWATVEMGKEAPPLTYIVVPGNPFQFDFEFSKPDQVKNVRVYLEGQEGEPVPAIREGNLFRAVVPTTRDALGGIYVDYDVKTTPHTFDGSLPDMNQIRAAFPPEMRDFEVVSSTGFVLADGKYKGTASLRFPQLDGATMSITLTVDPQSSYVPTEEEKTLAELSGIPSVQTRFDMTETETSLELQTKGYIPRGLFQSSLQASKNKDRVTALGVLGDIPIDLGRWEHTVEYGLEIKADVDKVKGNISKIKGQYSKYQGFAGKINKIMYNAETSGLDCLAEWPQTIPQVGKAVAAVVVGEVAKTALGAWTGAMGLTGAGAVVAGMASSVISHKIDNYVNQQIDAVGTGYNMCSDNPDFEKKNKYSRNAHKVAGPKWLYDPSGYVYEAVKSNPLPGVKATVLFQEEGTGTWKVWHAEDYDQTNPQLTDTAGKYGWDVPPGQWKVVWSKDGYETFTSDPLPVPPPQTEVNAGLVSRTPPQVSTVTGVTYQGGSYVDIMFSKYLKVTTLREGAAVVTDSVYKSVAGTLEFIGPEESAKEAGVMLSRTVRFTPKSPLTAGGTYTVKLDRSYYTSYANVPMAEMTHQDTMISFMMKELDKTGPVVQNVKVESGGRIIRVHFNEPIQPTADAAKFRVNGSADLVSSAVAVKSQDAAETQELLLSLTESIQAASSLSLLDGAVKDKEGNGSAADTRSLQPDLNSNLSSLTAASGNLSPAFNPEITAYNLQLPTGTKEIAMTAIAADPNAKLSIGVEPAVSGISKLVSIPDDGIILVMVELGGGVRVKTYTIQVSYGSSTGQGSSGSGSGSSGGSSASGAGAHDPLNLGETAVKEKKTDAGGRTSVVVQIAKDAVNEALKNTKESKELYVEVKEPADEMILTLPLEALRQMKQNQAALLLKTERMLVRWNAAVLQTGGLTDGTIIRLRLSMAEQQVAQAATEAAQRQNEALQLITGAALVTVEASSGDKAIALPMAAKRAIQGQLSIGDGLSGEVYRYDPDSAMWTYIPSQRTTDGKALLFDQSSPGYYAIMSLPAGFADTKGHWAQEEIDEMARRLLVNGVSPTEFKPEASVTRAEFAAMLVRALHLPVPPKAQAAPFQDVAPGAWYYEAVLAAASGKIVNGLESGRFAPNETITREQMAVMISRAYSLAGRGSAPTADPSDALKPFADSSRIQGWAQADAAFTLQEGLMNGMTEATFEPGGVTTRAQAVIVIGRLVKKQEAAIEQ
ncbi:S-layer homology domain-containing protein [Paenibacillus cremeus]|uniref:SLH domain-containing protein n=1 Tax=Paenibacillus cremeus TaxID=2163881 RepID=A0A559KDT6_9BACL|nr:S-layer homology domain-containing protein [Paenibacillus cremeus]TVY10278.1 hypothetical protein FPZ49_09460 [Paenibacillus cremeus]